MGKSDWSKRTVVCTSSVVRFPKMISKWILYYYLSITIKVIVFITLYCTVYMIIIDNYFFVRFWLDSGRSERARCGIEQTPLSGERDAGSAAQHAAASGTRRQRAPAAAGQPTSGHVVLGTAPSAAPRSGAAAKYRSRATGKRRRRVSLLLDCVMFSKM